MIVRLKHRLALAGGDMARVLRPVDQQRRVPAMVVGIHRRLPMGLQVAAVMGDDEDLLDWAAELERLLRE